MRLFQAISTNYFNQDGEFVQSFSLPAKYYPNLIIIHIFSNFRSLFLLCSSVLAPLKNKKRKPEAAIIIYQKGYICISSAFLFEHFLSDRRLTYYTGECESESEPSSPLLVWCVADSSSLPACAPHCKTICHRTAPYLILITACYAVLSTTAPD